MYFPYLRGRQYELLALRELSDKNLLGEYVIPIIEPVKLSSTLIKTLEKFIEKKQKISIIYNPKVGSFITDMNSGKSDTNKLKFLSLLESEYIIRAHIMEKNSLKEIETCEEYGFPREQWLIVNRKGMLKVYEEIFNKVNPPIEPRFVLMPDDSAFRRKIKHHRILFDDKFEKKDRNSDYDKECDEYFSDDHRYFSSDGYDGFSDFSIIGEGYLESGFAPYAVAIHIIYFDEEKSLRVRHFVSDSNEDIQNPAKKFYEAVTKLYQWCEQEQTDKTFGLEVLLSHYREQTYPGLGSVKKLSLMHHLELVGRYLREVK